MKIEQPVKRTEARPAIDGEQDEAYRALLKHGLADGSFGPLDPLERAILSLRAGLNDPPRDATEVAVKLGQSPEWVRLVEEMLLERLARRRRRSPARP